MIASLSYAGGCCEIRFFKEKVFGAAFANDDAGIRVESWWLDSDSEEWVKDPQDQVFPTMALALASIADKIS